MSQWQESKWKFTGNSKMQAVPSLLVHTTKKKPSGSIFNDCCKNPVEFEQWPGLWCVYGFLSIAAFCHRLPTSGNPTRNSLVDSNLSRRSHNLCGQFTSPQWKITILLNCLCRTFIMASFYVAHSTETTYPSLYCSIWTKRNWL